MSKTDKGRTNDNKEQANEHEVLASWSYHPLAESPRKTVLVGVFLVFIWVMAYLWFQAWGLAMAIIFTIWPLSGYLFPTQYTLTTKGIELRNLLSTQRSPWSRFVSYSAYPDAVQLEHDTSDLRGRITRGVVLFFNENGEQVTSVVREHIGATAPK